MTIAVVVAIGFAVAGCARTGVATPRSPASAVSSGGASRQSASPAPTPTSSPAPSTSPGPSVGPSASSPSPASPTPTPTPTPPPLPTLPALVPLGFTLHVPILTYHLVATPAEAGNALPGLVVPPSLFDAQLTTLAAAGWRTITLGALATDVAAHVRPPPKTFVITIDDGHSDGYTEALPILLRHGMLATYFVVAGRFGSGSNLDAEQVHGLAAAGMEIGDHTMYHVDLNALTPYALNAEIRRPLPIIAGITGAVPTVFAYPFGDSSATVRQAVTDAGLVLAVTTRFGAVEAPNLMLEIPRVHVGPGVTADYLLALVTVLARG